MPPKYNKSNIFAAKGGISASIDQQIADAAYSGSIDYQNLQAQILSSSMQAASASIVSQSLQDAQNESDANAIINSLPDLIRSAIGQGHPFAEIFEVKGNLTIDEAIEQQPVLHKLRKKCINHGLKFRILNSATGSLIACIKVDHLL